MERDIIPVVGPNFKCLCSLDYLYKILVPVTFTVPYIYALCIIETALLPLFSNHLLLTQKKGSKTTIIIYAVHSLRLVYVSFCYCLFAK